MWRVEVNLTYYILAVEVKRGVEIIGHNTDKFAMHVKGWRAYALPNSL